MKFTSYYKFQKNLNNSINYISYMQIFEKINQFYVSEVYIGSDTFATFHLLRQWCTICDTDLFYSWENNNNWFLRCDMHNAIYRSNWSRTNIHIPKSQSNRVRFYFSFKSLSSKILHAWYLMFGTSDWFTFCFYVNFRNRLTAAENRR